MQKTIVTVSVTVLLTTLILVSVFMFTQNKNTSLNKEVDIRESVDEMVGRQDGEFVKSEVVSDPEKINIEDSQKSKGEKENEINKGERKVSIVVQGDMNYVIYTDESGEEFIVDEANTFSSGTYGNIREFIDIYFSPNKNYIIYNVEFEGGNFYLVYDINTKSILKGFGFTHKIKFSPNEKYLFTCGNFDQFFSSAEVYEMSNKKKVFDIFGKSTAKGTEFYDGYEISWCHYDKKNNVIEFSLKNKKNNKDKKTIEFELK